MGDTVPRIEAREARAHLKNGIGALLVCAYDNEAKCQEAMLEGAITLSQFRARAGLIPKDREVIFYCA